MRNTLACVCLLALPLLACGARPESERIAETRQPIIGGKPTKVGDYPTVVAMVNSGLCTGTLIAPKVVILAAHCVTPSILGFSNQAQVTKNTQIVFDSVDVFGSSQGFAIQAANTIPHASFNQNTLTNDIGAVILTKAVTDRTPQPFAMDASSAQPGDLVDQVGYGVTSATSQNAGVEYAVLGKALADCGSILGYPGANKNFLCYSQTDGKGKCEGDSGGPSFRNIDGTQLLVGITSFGDQNCKQFGVDTRVSDQLAFIQMALDAGGACDADGTCLPACGAKDPDCLDCSADMFCTEGCGANGNPADSDCLACDADSACTPGCGQNGNPVDPDCAAACQASDGNCDPSCGKDGLPADPDCDQQDQSSGCSTAPGSGSSTHWMMLALALAALRSRKRR